MFIKLSPYLIAMLIGILIGVERERQNLSATQSMGVRSFLLISLCGAIAADINQPFISLGLLIFAAAATIVGYLRTTRASSVTSKSLGITTELAAIATFGLAYLAHSEPFLSIALAVVILFFLHNKTLLHTFIRNHLRPDEIQAAAVLLLLAVGVVPLLPNRTIDPFDIFNPFRLGLIIALVAGIQFAGYAATRIFGQQIGLPLSGLLAGVISSTAAFASLPQQAKDHPKNFLAVCAAATFALAATLAKLPIVLAVVSWRLAVALIIPIASLVILSVGLGVIFARNKKGTFKRSEPKNPLRILSALKIGVLLTVLIFAVELTERYLGPAYTNIVTFLSGLFELDGVIIANANMYDHQVTTLERASVAIMIGITASMISKIVITAFVGRDAYRNVMLVVVSSFFLVSLGFLGLYVFVPGVILSVN